MLSSVVSVLALTRDHFCPELASGPFAGDVLEDHAEITGQELPRDGHC
jgi:hypothetical protein